MKNQILINNYNEISQTLEGFKYSFLISATGIVVVALLGLLVLAIIHYPKDGLDIPSKWTVVVGLLFFLTATIIVNQVIISDSGDLKEEQDDIYANYQDLDRELVEVKVHDIVTSIAIPNSYCFIEKQNHTCYFLEFISDSDTTQVFVPLKEDIYSNSKGNISLFLYDFDKSDIDFLYEKDQLGNIAIQRVHSIKKKHWSMASHLKVN